VSEPSGSYRGNLDEIRDAAIRDWAALVVVGRWELAERCAAVAWLLDEALHEYAAAVREM